MRLSVKPISAGWASAVWWFLPKLAALRIT
ncbi:hypothetical protein PSEUDT2_04099 [Stutzerimonas stutzeri]|nr:hypothetical protein PSEUDT2_04099 [Stutzerimonas stutzeri]